MRHVNWILTLLLLGCAMVAHAQRLPDGPDWQPYGPEVFSDAASQQRLILLDLVAVWCHWCHVMEQTSYRDARVLAQLAQHYIAVKADHDARPDLAERYREYGWPATIILTPDGNELVKRAGYIAPDEMAALLARTAVDLRHSEPTLSTARIITGPAYLSDALRSTLQQRHLDAFDAAEGGLALNQKFLDVDAVEWDLHLAARGDLEAAARARRFLDAALALVDPVFGGAYQYSTHGDWAHPHYEKIMRTQAAYLRAYSLGYRHFGDPRYRQGAEHVVAWLRDFMRAPNGAFYTSQDADLEQGTKAHDYFALDRQQRLARGLPRIDRNQYADVNGQVIEGLVTLYRVTGEKAHLGLAVPALDWTLRNRRADGGGFEHGAGDTAGPYLADSLYMGRALLALYEASRQRAWLHEAAAAADFIDRWFRQPGGGLVSAADNGTPVKPVPQMDQNIHAARFLYALSAQTGDVRHAALADHTLRYLATPGIATSRLTDAGILLADTERRIVSTGRLSLGLTPPPVAEGGI